MSDWPREPHAMLDLNDMFDHDLEDEYHKLAAALPLSPRRAHGENAPSGLESPGRGTPFEHHDISGGPFLVSEAAQILRDAAPLLDRVEWSAEAGAIAARIEFLARRIQEG